MRRILLNSAVAVVAATLGTAALAGDGATHDKYDKDDKTLSNAPTTQPGEVRVQTDQNLQDDDAVQAGARIDADRDVGAAGSVEAGTGGTGASATVTEPDTVDQSTTIDQSDDAVKARAEMKPDQKDTSASDMAREQERRYESARDKEQKRYESARDEVDTDRAQTAGAMEEGRDESKPIGSDKPHLQNENPEKPHLADK